MVATSTSIISDGESRAPRRRSSDSRLSRSGAVGNRSSDSLCSRDMAVSSPKERIRDGAGVYSRFNTWRISNDQPLESEHQCSRGSDPTFVIERSWCTCRPTWSGKTVNACLLGGNYESPASIKEAQACANSLTTPWNRQKGGPVTERDACTCAYANG